PTNFEIPKPDYQGSPIIAEQSQESIVPTDQRPAISQTTLTESNSSASESQASNADPSPISREATIQPIATIKSASPTLEDVIPKNIRFERAKVTMYESSYVELNRFASYMITHPNLSVHIEGHTDPVGDKVSNQELSERRAYAIAAYLVKQGLSAARITAKGYGGSRPLVIPADGEYHPANRRVEFKISDGAEVLSVN
ncbi:MAG: OmpA family protein, partial [Bacteroidota bacterium]